MGAAKAEKKHQDKIKAVLLDDYPDLVFEHKFCAHRNWRFDAALPAHGIAIEIDGGAWLAGGKGGRHNRPQGFKEDMDKLNAAAFHGWLVFRCEPGGITRLCKQVRDFLGPDGRTLYCEGIADTCRSSRRKRVLPKRKFH